MSFVQALGGAIGLALGHCWRIAIVTLCCIPVLISGGVARLKAVQLSSSNAKFVVSVGRPASASALSSIFYSVSVFGPVFVPSVFVVFSVFASSGVSSSAAASVSVPPSLWLRLCHPATTCAASVFVSPLSTCCGFWFSNCLPLSRFIRQASQDFASNSIRNIQTVLAVGATRQFAAKYSDLLDKPEWETIRFAPFRTLLKAAPSVR